MDAASARALVKRLKARGLAAAWRESPLQVRAELGPSIRLIVTRGGVSILAHDARGIVTLYAEALPNDDGSDEGLDPSDVVDLMLDGWLYDFARQLLSAARPAQPTRSP